MYHQVFHYSTGLSEQPRLYNSASQTSSCQIFIRTAISVFDYGTYSHGIPSICTEQVSDQKEQVAAFVSTNIKRNDNLFVDSIEDLIKCKESEKKRSNIQSRKLR